MSGYFEMQCMCAQTGPPQYSYPKVFVGNGVRTHVNSKGKSPLPDGSEQGRTCDAALDRTQHTTD